MRTAIYARVSTLDQQLENQLEELRRYAAARGWQVKEYVDHGISGAKERRPALDQLIADAKSKLAASTIAGSTFGLWAGCLCCSHHQPAYPD